MATVVSPSAQQTVQAQCVLLRHVRWETYEHLLADDEDSSSPRFTYDRGMVEIMLPSPEHEVATHLLATLVELLTAEMEMDVLGVGSTTFRRPDVDRGFALDACFYIQHAAQRRGKKRLALTDDPPADLVIAGDITSPSLPRLPIFAALGVPEVWRYRGARVSILTLIAGQDVEQEASMGLPSVTSSGLTALIAAGQHLTRPAWRRHVHAWVQSQAG